MAVFADGQYCIHAIQKLGDTVSFQSIEIPKKVFGGFDNIDEGIPKIWNN